MSVKVARSSHWVIRTLEGNGLAVYLGEDDVIYVKDQNGSIQPLKELIGSLSVDVPEGGFQSGTSGTSGKTNGTSGSSGTSGSNGKTERRVKMDWTVHRGHQVLQEVQEQAALTVRQALQVIAVWMEVQEVRELQA